jgi:UDP-2-acetamido-2-deoxy-ribo-hexuluronate aminotransferase
MENRDIPTAVYYPKPLHLQTAFSSLCYRKGDFPIAESTADRIFSLPMHPYPERQQIAAIGTAIALCCNKCYE